MQLDLFPHENAWAKQQQAWWDMHDFQPKPGDLVLITGRPPYWGLEGEILSIDKGKNETVVRIRKYPDCPWIPQAVLKLEYYGVDPILYRDSTQRRKDAKD